MACGALGSEAREAVPALIECTVDEPELVEEAQWLRLRAAVAVYRISGDGEIARKVAGELLSDSEEWLVVQSISTLAVTNYAPQHDSMCGNEVRSGLTKDSRAAWEKSVSFR